MKSKKKLTLENAENAIRAIAKRDGISIETVRANMKGAILAGLCDPDPKVQARWKSIPCKGELPTPEELIVFLANESLERK